MDFGGAVKICILIIIVKLLCISSVNVILSAGKGWYRYEKPGGRVATADEDVTDIIKAHCSELGIQRRVISTQVWARQNWLKYKIF